MNYLLLAVLEPPWLGATLFFPTLSVRAYVYVRTLRHARSQANDNTNHHQHREGQLLLQHSLTPKVQQLCTTRTRNMYSGPKKKNPICVIGNIHAHVSYILCRVQYVHTYQLARKHTGWIAVLFHLVHQRKSLSTSCIFGGVQSVSRSIVVEFRIRYSAFGIRSIDRGAGVLA